MEFGTVPTKDAEGGILAHSLALPGGKRLRKGQVLNADLLEEIRRAGIEKVIVARPASDDVLEDDAASRIAASIDLTNLRADEARTGRVNFFATCDGLFNVRREHIDAINAIDPAITIATLDKYSNVREGRMVATIKIIPYAVSGKALEQVLSLDLANAFSVTPFTPKRVALIATQLPSLKPATLDKTRQNLEKRLAQSGSTITNELRVEHTAEAVADAIRDVGEDHDMLILFGASAISDIQDIIPEAIRFSGGEIIRFGMPVDPGNLLLLATLNGKPVIGAPGCARSPAENGFDWVLNRLLADIPPESINLSGMGVGGLLMETGSRPHSRLQPKPPKPGTAQSSTSVIVLAAGQSRRMGTANKMTVEVSGKPMVRHVVEAALASEASHVKVVTGHKAQETLSALSTLEFAEAHNKDYAKGLSSSLAAGISALPDNATSAIVLLGDMPFITPEMIDRMILASRENPGHIIMATHDGKRGNPVLWPARFFEELRTISGDVGARHIIGENADFVIEVELGSAASLDLDTPEAIAALSKF